MLGSAFKRDAIGKGMLNVPTLERLNRDVRFGVFARVLAATEHITDLHFLPMVRKRVTGSVSLFRTGHCLTLGAQRF